MKTGKIDLVPSDIFNYVTGIWSFHPFEVYLDPTTHKFYDGKISRVDGSHEVIQSIEFRQCCAFIDSLKRDSKKIPKGELEHLCEEVVDFSPLKIEFE